MTNEEVVSLLSEAQTLFALGVGAMTDNGDRANQERCMREGGELMLKISKAVVRLKQTAGGEE